MSLCKGTCSQLYSDQDSIYFKGKGRLKQGRFLFCGNRAIPLQVQHNDVKGSIDQCTKTLTSEMMVLGCGPLHCS